MMVLFFFLPLQVYADLEANEFGDGFSAFLRDLDALSSRLRSDKPGKGASAAGKGAGSKRQAAGKGSEDDDDDDDDDDGEGDEEKDGDGDGNEGSGVESDDAESDEDDDNDDDDEGVRKKRMPVVAEEARVGTYRPTAGEDIYGRPIDASGSGAVAPRRYVPPALRAKQAVASSAGGASGGSGSAGGLGLGLGIGATGGGTDGPERLEALSRLRRSVTGCLNRLAEQSLEPVANEVRHISHSAS